MDRARSRRRIRNFLIYREHQLHYAVQMVLVAAGLTAALGFLIYRFNAEAARVVDLRAMDPTDGDAQLLQAAFRRSEAHLVVGLVGFGLLLSVVLAIWQIVISHKVAGPLYYVAHQARRLRDGHLGPLHPLRKGDMLHAFFETFREMHDALRERARGDAEALARLAARLEAGGGAAAEEVAGELRALERQRRAALDDAGGE